MSTHDEHPRSARPGARLVAAVREHLSALAELRARRLLLDRPWQQEFLHAGADGRVHGWFAPPDRRRRSTTRGGWCPCGAREQLFS